MQNPLPIENVQMQEGREDQGAFRTFPPRSYWGENDSWYLFRAEVTIPEEYAGETVRGHLKTGRQGWNALNPQFLLKINGKVIQALDTNHQTFLLEKDAKAGDTFYMEFEAYSGREIGNTVTFQDAPLQFDLSIYCHHDLVEQAYYDLAAPWHAAGMYPESDYRRIQIETYLTQAINRIDLRKPSSPEYFASLSQAVAYMEKEFYGAYCGDESVIANCIGHTHIDVAWLWTLEQTRAKALRSFSTELTLMEEYPEHHFSSSQPQLYQFVKENCPQVYESIKEKVAEGAWEVEGAMWLEADCNLTSGESLIRQILHGKRFMKEEFGVDSKVLWLPDVFGYSAAMPQILKKTGVETFVTSKIHWNETNHFPYDTFLWKGIDGSEIFTQFITAGDPDVKLGDENKFSSYNAQILPIAMAKGWEIYQQKAINNEILVSFGYGDGGGGVTREMLEMQRRLEKGIPGTPKTRLTTIADTLSRIKENVKGKKIPRWFGELYLELHRGTYTSQAKNKRYNRYCELLLAQVETASLLGKHLLGKTYPKTSIYNNWTTVLLNQFHDIIPGSSIHEVYEESHRQYEDLISENESRLQKSLESLAAQVCHGQQDILVYNPCGLSQDGIIEHKGKKYFVENVPALGWKTISVNAAEDCKNHSALQTSESHLENDYFSIDIDETGALSSIYDKKNDREILTDRGNVLEAYDDHPHEWDNWELNDYHRETRWEINDVASIETQMDEVSASVMITRHFLDSDFQQTITIYRDIPRIDFELESDWHEHHVFVKTAFPVDILSDKATYEIQYGAVERPTHSNTSWDQARFEVCAQKWVDYSEYGYGVALLNDCKYGHDIHDGVMRLSLIKCGTYPDAMADQGHHHARYSLVPHAGSWQEAEIPKKAYGFNCPLYAVSVGDGDVNVDETNAIAVNPEDANACLESSCRSFLPASYSFAQTDCNNVIITVAKEACDDDAIILRAYEANGMRSKTMFTLGFEAAEVCEVNMLENEVFCQCELMESEENSMENRKFTTVFKPYEIKTFKISQVKMKL